VSGVDVNELTIADEVANVGARRPHVVLLGAGASRAALPEGDRNGLPVPLLRDVAKELDLVEQFPPDLQQLAVDNFEAAYSQLHDRDAQSLPAIDEAVRGFFARIELPDHSTLYDQLVVSLRPKDAVFTFNWDPLLLQAWQRVFAAGVRELPQLHFLHGNVSVGYCPTEFVPGPAGSICSCGERRLDSPLLFPVEHKNYQANAFIESEWRAARAFLEGALFFTVFGYSAPVTDVEAIQLLKEGWGDAKDRQFEQTEVINRPRASEDELRATWDPSFIRTTSRFTGRSASRGWPTILGVRLRRFIASTSRRSSLTTTRCPTSEVHSLNSSPAESCCLLLPVGVRTL
jgi:hypothetical protein